MSYNELNEDEKHVILQKGTERAGTGELTDNDGFVYRKGDLVLLKKGTQHNSHSESGALLAVYIPTAERAIEE